MTSATVRPGTSADAELPESLAAVVAATIDEGIAGGVFPGAVAAIARRGVVAVHVARGDARRVGSRLAMTPETVFDLASLTKVVGTLPAVLSACADGRLALDEPLRAIFPEMSGDGRELVTARHLLAHTAGYPAWRMFYLDTRGRAEVLREILRTPLVAPPGTRVVYSDYGFLLLGFVLERVLAASLDEIVSTRVTGPLGMKHTCFRPPAHVRPMCAATEEGNAFERLRAGSAGADFPWRTHVLQGEVHDGNAAHATDGVAGHAGLFAPVWDVLVSAQQWLRPGVVVPAALAAAATSLQTAGAEGPPRGLGWMLHHAEAFFAALGPRSFGHTGFTGTAVAIDPDLDLVVGLLTNRVHPAVTGAAINAFRTTFIERVRRAIEP